MNNMKKHSERGAIMLEVIAVLSLMGLMGAMLFRQIYKRNQELQNIQMASEIRVVKEAFSAYIQANGAEISCPNLSVAMAPQHCEVPGKTLAEVVKDYLPTGFLPSAGEGWGADTVDALYDFKLLGYLRGPDNVAGQGIRTFLGVVTPKRAALPDGVCDEDDSAWNTRRAARIAMLIGIDGGIFSKGVTSSGAESDDIAGTVGTWHLSTATIFGGVDNMYETLNLNRCAEPPIYLAITELDVYSPEIDLPDQRVNLPKDWDLALEKGHVFDEFRVGGKSKAGCYAIHHNTVDSSAGVQLVSQDIMGTLADCMPAFWVETEHTPDGDKGQVYVLNDLHVGADAAHVQADGVTLSKTGEIATPNLVITKDGRIVSTDKTPSGLSEHGDKNYELDLAYTSTMNDIRLASRGGARLSDILPKYILKEQTEVSNSSGNPSNIEVPTCPAGYKAAVAVIPTRWDIDLNADTELVKEEVGSETSLDSATFPVTGGVVDIKENGLKGIPVNTTTGGTTPYAIVDHDAQNDVGTVSGAAVSLNGLKAKTTMDRNSICVMIDDPTNAAMDGSINTWEVPTPRPANPEWAITLGKMGYVDPADPTSARECHSDSNIHAIVQTYCVFVDDAAHGVATTGNIGEARLNRFAASNNGTSFTTSDAQAACEGVGMVWSGTECVLPARANATTAATCRLAGGRWTGWACEEVSAAPAGGENPAPTPSP